MSAYLKSLSPILLLWCLTLCGLGLFSGYQYYLGSLNVRPLSLSFQALLSDKVLRCGQTFKHTV